LPALDPKEVFNFLCILEKHTRENGREDLANALHKASLFYRIPLTSEFYGEAMLALEHVVSKGINVLSDQDKTNAEALAQAIKHQWFETPRS
jgi:hypothetical protein